MEAQGKANMEKNKDNINAMADMSKGDKLIWLAGMIGDTESQISLLEKGLLDFNRANIAVPAIQEVKGEKPEDGKPEDAEMTTSYSTADDRYADPSKFVYYHPWTSTN